MARQSNEVPEPYRPLRDELWRLILKEDISRLGKRLKACDESERKALAGPVYHLYRQIWSGKIVGGGQGVFARATLAVVGLAELADAKKVPVASYWSQPEVEQLFIELLGRRTIAWQSSWLKAQLAFRDCSLSWAIIEALARGGVELDPESDDLIRHLGDRYNELTSTLSARLRSSPVLVLVRRLFEVPNGALTANWAGPLQRQQYPQFETWSQALVSLCQSGHLNRSELLKASVEGLHRDLPALQLCATVDFHNSLQPVAAERAELLQSYLDLMASRQSKVAGAAVKWCLSVESLDPRAFLRAAEPTLGLPTKTVAMTVLKAARKLAGQDPALKDAAVELATSGLSHSHREVSEQARAWLKELGKEDGSAVPAPANPEPLPPELSLEGIESCWVALMDLEGDDLPRPLDYVLWEVPFRTSSLEPIACLDELIDSVAAAVEECRSGDEVERLLDGLSRFGGQRPRDFELRTEALRKRVESMVDSETVKGLVSGWGGMSREIKGLLLSWLSGRQVLVPHHNFAQSSPLYPFIAGRLRELSARVVTGDCGPLLSAPTCRGGWVEPSALVDRLASCSSLETHRFDLLAALLRLSPHGREAALQRTREFSHEEGRALAWALGGEGPRRGDLRSELWLAAGRSRYPREALTAELGFEEPARQLSWSVPEGKPPRWGGSQAPTASTLRGLVSSVKGLFTRVRPGPELDPTGCCYGVMRQAWNEPDNHGVWSLHWRALVWPGNLDSYWRQAALCLGERWDSDGSGLAPNHIFLEPLFEPDRPWDDLARVVIWMALLSKASEIRGAAVDLLIEGIGDGRGHPEPLGQTLCQLAPAGLKTNRLASALAQIAGVGELHRWTVAQILSRLFREQTLPHAAHHLLELMLSVCDSISDELRAALTSHRGRGKVASQIAALLKLPGAEPGARIARLMRAARIERARAWSTTRGRRHG